MSSPETYVSEFGVSEEVARFVVALDRLEQLDPHGVERYRHAIESYLSELKRGLIVTRPEPRDFFARSLFGDLEAPRGGV